MKAVLDQIAVPSLLVDGEDGPGLVAEYEVFHFPAVFLWQDGEYHARLQVAATAVAIVEGVAAALRQPPEPEP